MGKKRPSIEACRAPEPEPGQRDFSKFTQGTGLVHANARSNASLQEQLRDRLELPPENSSAGPGEPGYAGAEDYRASRRLRSHLYAACEMTPEQRRTTQGERASGWSDADSDLWGSPYSGQWPEDWECEVLREYIKDHKGLFAKEYERENGERYVYDDYHYNMRLQGQMPFTRPVPRPFNEKGNHYEQMRAPYQWANEGDAACAEQVADCVYDTTEGLMSHSDSEVLACVEHVDKADLALANRMLKHKHPEETKGEDLRERVMDDITPFTKNRARASEALGQTGDFKGLQVCASLGMGRLQGARCWGITDELEPFGSVGMVNSASDWTPEASLSVGMVSAGRECYNGLGYEATVGVGTPVANVSASGSALLTSSGEYCGYTASVGGGLGDVSPVDISGSVGVGEATHRRKGP